MESIGQTLRASRESRGITIEQVSRDTNISKHYLIGLEEDKHDVFPAEPYILGFLRNYSEHLGLDTEDLLNRYRTLKIQEQPAPMTELIRQPSPWPQRTLLWGGAGVAVILVLIFVIPAVIDFIGNLPKAISSAPALSDKVYDLPETQTQITPRVFVGDTISLTLGSNAYKFQVKSIGSDVVLTGSAGEYKMRLGDELFIDLDGNSQQDVRFFLKDLNPADPSKGAEVTLERLAKTPTLAEGTQQLGNELKPDLAAAGSATGAEQKPIVVLDNADPKPFTVDVIFRGAALFRYVVDDNLREENYFRKGDTVRIEASKKVKLWVSNAAAFSGKINAQTDFEIGNSGEVSSRILEWSKDAAGKSILVADPLN